MRKMKAKLIMIGQAPSRRGPSTPLMHPRLVALSGLSPDRYQRRFRRLNVFDAWQGKNGEGDAFPMKEARTRAEALMMQSWLGKCVLFVGVGTARAFGVKTEPLEWFRFNGSRAAVFPHPSGINRFWNSRKNRALARAFLRNALREVR